MIFPPAWAARMQATLQDEWEAFAAAHEKPRPLSLRINPYKKNALSAFQPLIRARVPWNPHGYYLTQKWDFLRDPLWQAGAYYVQEASSMSLYAFLPPASRPLRILDLAAAPGGKTSLLLSFYDTQALIWANEVHPLRRKALTENLHRWGYTSFLITKRDPQRWAQLFPEAFDIVLLDAPCSGEGLFRKEPHLMQTWKEAHVHFCSRRQRRLLAAAAQLVAPQGILIYATCTYAPQENEHNLAWLMQTFPGWQAIPWGTFSSFPRPTGIQEVTYGKKGLGYYFYPHRIEGEGFFISALQKVASPTQSPLYKASFPSIKHPEIERFLTESHLLWQTQNQIYGLPQQLRALLLPDKAPQIGYPLAYASKKLRWHAAWATCVKHHYPRENLPLETLQALLDHRSVGQYLYAYQGIGIRLGDLPPYKSPQQLRQQAESS
ncbi:MAG: methyltransferase RsmF C-terminal domain-like protein [Bacteroidia bacterium]